MDNRLLMELEIVARRGADQASACLSAFLGRNVAVTVNGVSTVDIEQIPEELGGGSALAVGLLSRVVGEICGNAVLLFERSHALNLVKILGGDSSAAFDGFGALERSMLEETANITISSFMNSMTNHLARRCVPNAPVYLLDMAGAILSVVLMESAAVADTAVVFSTRFACQDESLAALFVFLPSPAALGQIEEGLAGESTS